MVDYSVISKSAMEKQGRNWKQFGSYLLRHPLLTSSAGGLAVGVPVAGAYTGGAELFAKMNEGKEQKNITDVAINNPITYGVDKVMDEAINPVAAALGGKGLNFLDSLITNGGRLSSYLAGTSITGLGGLGAYSWLQHNIDKKKQTADRRLWHGEGVLSRRGNISPEERAKLQEELETKNKTDSRLGISDYAGPLATLAVGGGLGYLASKKINELAPSIFAKMLENKNPANTPVSQLTGAATKVGTNLYKLASQKTAGKWKDIFKILTAPTIVGTTGGGFLYGGLHSIGRQTSGAVERALAQPAKDMADNVNAKAHDAADNIKSVADFWKDNAWRYASGLGLGVLGASGAYKWFRDNQKLRRDQADKKRLQASGQLSSRNMSEKDFVREQAQLDKQYRRDSRLRLTDYLAPAALLTGGAGLGLLASGVNLKDIWSKLQASVDSNIKAFTETPKVDSSYGKTKSTVSKPQAKPQAITPPPTQVAPPISSIPQVLEPAVQPNNLEQITKESRYKLGDDKKKIDTKLEWIYNPETKSYTKQTPMPREHKTDLQAGFNMGLKYLKHKVKSEVNTMRNLVTNDNDRVINTGRRGLESAATPRMYSDGLMTLLSGPGKTWRGLKSLCGINKENGGTWGSFFSHLFGSGGMPNTKAEADAHNAYIAKALARENKMWHDFVTQNPTFAGNSAQDGLPEWYDFKFNNGSNYY